MMRGQLAARTKRRLPEWRESATHRVMWLALTLCLLGLSPTGFAQTLSQTETQKLLASDAPSPTRVAAAAPYFLDFHQKYEYEIWLLGGYLG